MEFSSRMNSETSFSNRPSHSTVPFPQAPIEGDIPPAPPKPSLWPKIKSFASTSYNVGGKVLKSAFYIMLFFALLGGFSQSSGQGYKHLYGSGDNQIAVINLQGVIMESSTPTAFAQEQVITPDGVTRVFESLQTNDQVKAIVLRINSPGGSVTATEEIYQLILHYRQRLNMPIVASFGETAASGGYYIGLAADQIVANSTSLTGSIGVILQTINVSELANRYGVQNVVIKSGDNKNLLDPLEPVDPQQIALLQQTVDEAYGLFTNRILERREIESAALAQVADGRVLSGEQAKARGLVDSVGTFRQAVDTTASLVNLSHYQVVEYGQPGLLESFFSAFLNNFRLNVSLTPDLVGSSLRGKPAYLYQY